jgi:hypothetical protein
MTTNQKRKREISRFPFFMLLLVMLATAIVTCDKNKDGMDDDDDPEEQTIASPIVGTWFNGNTSGLVYENGVYTGFAGTGELWAFKSDGKFVSIYSFNSGYSSFKNTTNGRFRVKGNTVELYNRIIDRETNGKVTSTNEKLDDDLFTFKLETEGTDEYFRYMLEDGSFSTTRYRRIE